MEIKLIMIKKMLLWPLILITSLLFSSCPFGSIRDGDHVMQRKSFDEETFLFMWEKWKSLEIKNYTFNYYCRYFYGGTFYSAKVTVKNGSGNVDKVYVNDFDDSGYVLSSLYYVYSINDIYEHIWDFYTDKKQRVQEGSLTGIYSDGKAGYDEKYHIPYVRLFYKPSDCYNSKGEYESNFLFFEIRDFKVLE